MPKRLPILLACAALLTPVLALVPGPSSRPCADRPVTGLQSPATASPVLAAASGWFQGITPLQHVEAAASPAAGQMLFQEKGCVVCHGEQLQGTDKGPSLRGVGRTLKREQIEHQIRNGGDNMPAFGEDSIAPDELAILVDFLAHQKKRK